MEQIIIALISFFGTAVGTFGGIRTSNKLTNYKIEELTKKVEKHNNLIERMYKIEERVTVLEKRSEIK